MIAAAATLRDAPRDQGGGNAKSASCLANAAVLGVGATGLLCGQRRTRPAQRHPACSCSVYAGLDTFTGQVRLPRREVRIPEVVFQRQEAVSELTGLPPMEALWMLVHLGWCQRRRDQRMAVLRHLRAEKGRSELR